jgi:hypothetical protein
MTTNRPLEIAASSIFDATKWEENMNPTEPKLPNDQPRDEPWDLPADVRRRIDGHLDAIEQVLFASGMLRGERRTIVDEVETQIHEMLAARPGQEPAEAVAAILSQLDPPSAYAPESAAAPTNATKLPQAGPASIRKTLWTRWQSWWSPPSDAPRISRPALVAAAWAGLAAFLFLAAFAERGPGLFLALFFAVGLTAPIGVTALGFWAVRRIRRSGGRETGLPLALVETFFFPIVLANLALIGLLAASDGTGLVILAVLVIVGANIGLARYAWRRYGDQFLAKVVGTRE